MSPRTHRVRDVVLAAGALAVAVLVLVWGVGSSIDREVSHAVGRIGDPPAITTQ